MRTEEFVGAWLDLERQAHGISVDHGWWDGEQNDAEKIALMHSELSEALEGMREPGMSEKIPEFTKVEEELADAIIRIADFSAARFLCVAQAVVAKAEYNRTRSYKHGGKRF